MVKATYTTITKFAMLFILGIFLWGCGAGKTVVLDHSAPMLNVQKITIDEGPSTVSVPKEVKEKFISYLDQYLYKEYEFQRGKELILQYRFIQFNPGSQFVRWFWGGLGSAGKGTMTVEVRFLTPEGKEIAKIQAEGEITSGLFGGSFDHAIEKCAKEVATYAKQNFRISSQK